MKQTPLFYLLFAGLISSVSAKSEIISPNKFYGDSTSISIPSVEKLWQQIITITGSLPELHLREADVLNLEASVSNRKKYISYNPVYINWVTTITGDKWAALTLLAHEAGHHLKGHTTHKTKDRLAAELEADEYAGFILYKLGATLGQTQEVMKFIAKKEDSETHPAQASRMLALKTGWDKAFNENIAAIEAEMP
jgi:hypothetical protein